MKKILFCVLMLVPVLLYAQDTTGGGDTYSNCLKKTSSKWAGSCSQCQGPASTYRVNLTNTCKETLDVKVAVQEKTKKWRTFSLLNIAPGDSVSAYACAGTGKYVFWARKAGDQEVVFPADDEINLQYTK